MRAEEKNLELEMKSRDEKLEKLRVQANMSRDTSTLLATNHQMQTIKDENAKLEDRALGLVDRINEVERDFDKQEKEVAKIQELYNAFAENCEKELAETKQQLETLDRDKSGVTVKVSREILETYNRLFQARDGLAVCPIDGDVCSGCSTVLLPNDLMKVKSAKDIIYCKSCSRALFVQK